MTDHRQAAEEILSRADATLEELLRAIAHAVLAGVKPPLFMDAYNPTHHGRKPE